ncbi:MAG: 1-acyl-sn-glycerol-3-phosphate acyltransferase [Bacteroidota bacterium]
MIYQIFRYILGLAARIYFKKITIISDQALPKDKGLVLVANHHSGVMDAILIAIISPRPLLFLTRGESFDTPLKRWMWSLLNMIPIYRPHITPKLSAKNKGIMQHCRKQLLKGKALTIFPEGLSQTARRLKTIKTGAARIVLEAAAEGGYADELVLVPIGLNYSNPHRFRSEVLINIGPPIELEEDYQVHQKDQRRAVQQLSGKIADSLEALIIHLRSPDLDPLYDQLYQVHQEVLCQAARPFPKRVFKEQQHLAQTLQHLYDQNPQAIQQLKKTMDAYMGLHILLRQKRQEVLRGKLRYQRMIQQLVFQYAKVHYFLVMHTTRYLTERWTKRPDFYGTLLLCLGTLMSMIWLPLQIGIAYWIGGIALGLLYGSSLIAILPIALAQYDQQQVICKITTGKTDDLSHRQLETYRLEIIDLLNDHKLVRTKSKLS